jgi:4-oxalocrotonate tautomerase
MVCCQQGFFVLSKRGNELTTNVLITLLKTEIMPYVKIEVTREGVTRQQKQELIAGVTQLITDVLDKDPHLTHVVIQEIELDDWGYAGEQVSVLREKGITAKRNQ